MPRMQNQEWKQNPVQQISFSCTFFIVGSEMASQKQSLYGCFMHQSPQSPDITWTNILYFSLKITAIWPDPNLNLLWTRQSDAVLFCENYGKLYFDAKYLKKVLNRGGKKVPFWPISDAVLPPNVKLNISLFLSGPSRLLKDETKESQGIAS